MIKMVSYLVNLMMVTSLDYQVLLITFILNREIQQILHLLRVKPWFYPKQIKLCGWFILVFHFSIVLFYVSILIYAKTLKSFFSDERLRNTKNSSVVDTESIRPKLSELIYWQQSHVLNLNKLIYMYEHYSLQENPYTSYFPYISIKK